MSAAPGRATCAIEPAGDNRTARRRVVSLPAYARETNATLMEVQISNLSTDGCRLKAASEFEPATAVWLKIPGVTPRRATIRWTKGTEAGCEFDCPISESALTQASASAEEAARATRKTLRAHFG